MSTKEISLSEFKERYWLHINNAADEFDRGEGSLSIAFQANNGKDVKVILTSFSNIVASDGVEDLNQYYGDAGRLDSVIDGVFNKVAIGIPFGIQAHNGYGQNRTAYAYKAEI